MYCPMDQWSSQLQTTRVGPAEAERAVGLGARGFGLGVRRRGFPGLGDRSPRRRQKSSF
eukprot:SAG11_NODE_47_length_20431_cov_7.472752_24_plen_59_part_00